jgi:hypothetical protein
MTRTSPNSTSMMRSCALAASTSQSPLLPDPSRFESRCWLPVLKPEAALECCRRQWGDDGGDDGGAAPNDPADTSVGFSVVVGGLGPGWWSPAAGAGGGVISSPLAKKPRRMLDASSPISSGRSLSGLYGGGRTQLVVFRSRST